MEDPDNRMATPRKRGRPSNAEVAARADPVAAEEVTVSVPMQGLRCPGCGRSMVPRVLKTKGAVRYCACSLCPARMVVEYDPVGRAMKVRLL